MKSPDLPDAVFRRNIWLKWVLTPTERSFTSTGALAASWNHALGTPPPLLDLLTKKELGKKSIFKYPWMGKLSKIHISDIYKHQKYLNLKINASLKFNS